MITLVDELEWWELVLACIIGGGVGYIGGYCGIGGAPFMVALLNLVLSYPQHLAQGTVLAVMLPPMSIMGAYVMKDRTKRLWKISLPAVGGYAVFSYLGATLAFLLKGDTLTYVFGGFLIAVGIRYARQFITSKLKAVAAKATSNSSPKSKINELAEMKDPETNDGNNAETGGGKPQLERRASVSEVSLSQWNVMTNPGYVAFDYKASLITGCFIGLVGGFFGIGAGVLKVPIFTEVFGMNKDDARCLSLLILLPPVSIGAIIKYQSEKEVDWPMAGMLLALYVCFNYPGAKKGLKASTATFKMVMGMCLAVLGTFLIIDNALDLD